MPQNNQPEAETGGQRHTAQVVVPSPERHLRKTTGRAQQLAVGASLVVCATVFLQIAKFDPPKLTGAQAAFPHSTPRQAAPPSATQTATHRTASLGQPVTIDEAPTDSRKPPFRTEAIRGQVVWLADALQQKFGISTVPEVAENALALLTADGQLWPIVENLRGRAFRRDERLRGKDMEILARRYVQQPLIQILRVYEIVDGQRYEVDYWCDVCAIIMFETGPCACCQDHNRLRKRLATGDED